MPAGFDALFEKNIDVLAASLDKAVQKALGDYRQLHNAGQKGELAYIYISFLLSSILCKLPWLRIDLYDENDRNDLTECYVDWDIAPVSDKLYSDAESLKRQSDRMKDYELEQAWLEASDEYRKALEANIPSIIKKCPLTQKISCEWHFGQYLGSTISMWENDKDEIF